MVRRAGSRALAGAAALALALPLAACATDGAAAPRGGLDLLRAGCPAEVVIDSGTLPDAASAYLYALLDRDETRALPALGVVRGPLVVDGEPTGVTLEIRTRDPYAAVDGSEQLYVDPDILLGAVRTDRAILAEDRFPVVMVFAPLSRDPRVVYWNAAIYPGARGVDAFGQTLTPDGTGLTPVLDTALDPFLTAQIGATFLQDVQVQRVDGDPLPAFVEADGVAAAVGDSATLLPRLEAADVDVAKIRTQSLETAGYALNSGVLAARPRAVVGSADCLSALVPELQRALVRVTRAPDAVLPWVAELAGRMGDPADAELVAGAFDALVSDRMIGNAGDPTIGDLDLGRLRELLEDVAPDWREAGLDVPGDLKPEDLVTDRFLDPSIGL